MADFRQGEQPQSTPWSAAPLLQGVNSCNPAGGSIRPCLRFQARGYERHDVATVFLDLLGGLFFSLGTVEVFLVSLLE